MKADRASPACVARAPTLGPRRRGLLGLGAALAWPWPPHTAQARDGQVLSPRTLVFPRDHGAHTEERTEWWYLTGETTHTSGRRYGFQITFFRSRVDGTQGLQSRLAARQLLFAHAAVTDVHSGRNRHDQRTARWNGRAPQLPNSPAAVWASDTDTEVRLRGWFLARGPDGRYTARIRAADFALDIVATPSQALLLQGEQGFSRKGPDAGQASFYYSQPQLAVTGQLALTGPGDIGAMAVQGRAWLDHEWSEALLHPQAVGWDWMGMNLQNGASLTAFQMRRGDGSALWAGGSYRGPPGTPGSAGQAFDAQAVRWTAQRFWTSPANQTRYPVEWAVQTPAGRYTVRAVVDAQELDSRQSTGTVYWEGLSDLFDARGERVGSGYLEMTGYAQRMVL